MIRRLHFPDDEATYRALRQEALTRAAASFRSTALDDLQHPRKLDTYGPGAENAVFGAFVDGQLVGIVGYDRETREKLRHKGWVWGMYVRAEAGTQGLGRQLLRTATNFARTQPGLEQVLLTVVATNANARHLYISEGFEVVGLEHRAIKWKNQYLDEETMVLFL